MGASRETGQRAVTHTHTQKKLINISKDIPLQSSLKKSKLKHG